MFRNKGISEYHVIAFCCDVIPAGCSSRSPPPEGATAPHVVSVTEQNINL